MAQVYTLIKSWVNKGLQDQKTGIASIAFGDSTSNPDDRYKTGGIPIPAASVAKSLSTIYTLVPIGGSGGYVFQWDRANQKLMCFHTNLDTTTDGPLVELPADSAALGTANIVLEFTYTGI